MCNVPCELFGDSEDCYLYFNQLEILKKLNESENFDCNSDDKILLNVD